MDKSNGAKCSGPLIAWGLKLRGLKPRNKAIEMFNFKVMHCWRITKKK